MAAIPMRFSGGALDGKTLWVEDNCTELSVQVAGDDGGATRQLHYRREGDLLLYMGEGQADPRPEAPPKAEPKKAPPTAQATPGVTMANWFGRGNKATR